MPGKLRRKVRRTGDRRLEMNANPKLFPRHFRKLRKPKYFIVRSEHRIQYIGKLVEIPRRKRTDAAHDKTRTGNRAAQFLSLCRCDLGKLGTNSFEILHEIQIQRRLAALQKGERK